MAAFQAVFANAIAAAEKVIADERARVLQGKLDH